MTSERPTFFISREPKPKKQPKALRRTPLKRSKVSAHAKRSFVRKRSKKGRAEDARYRVLKAEHFKSHPYCEHPSGCWANIHDGNTIIDLHHRAGRGPLLCCTKYFATACRFHHDLAKSDIRGSEVNGWIVRLRPSEVRQLKEQGLT